MRNITTLRLELVPATLDLVEAELASHESLSQMLGANIPENWPPGEYDRPAIEYFKSRLSENPEGAGWYSWYAILRADCFQPATLVGAGGYFGPPSAERSVEVGYSIAPGFEGKGYATELVRALVQHALSTGVVTRVIAHTTAANVGSIRVLEKSGFRLVGPGKASGTIEYEYGIQFGG